jgi:tetratricopeptide (TPR) repeat protein
MIVRSLLCAVLCLLLPAIALAIKPDLKAARDAHANADYELLLSLVEPIVAAGDADGETFYLQGEALRFLDRSAEAEEAYQRALDKKHREPEVYAGMSLALIALDRAADVSDLVEKPLSKEKDLTKKAVLEYALGKADLALGNYSDAQTWLLQARYDDPDNMEYRITLGDAYYYGQILPLATAEYDAVVAEDSSRIDVMYRLAEAYYSQQQLNQALPVLTKLLARDSTYYQAYFMLANINMIAAESNPGESRQYYARALSLYRRVRDVDPNADPVLVAKNIAKVYYILNFHDSAVVELQNAIETGADDPELQFYLGRSNMLLKNYADAITAFQAYRAALEAADPPHEWTLADAEVFWRTASCMEATGDSALWPQVAENYRRAIELDPDDERSINQLGLTLHRMGRYLEAAVEFEKLVVRHPEDAQILFNASLPYLQSDNNEKAVELLLRAAESDTTAENRYRARAYKLSGPRLIRMQRISDAQKAYRWLVQNEPEMCEHKQWLGFTLFAQKNYSGCIQYLRRAYQCNEQRDPSGCGHNELRWWLAYAQYEVGESDASYELLEKVLDCSPDNMDARNLANRIDEETIEE